MYQGPGIGIAPCRCGAGPLPPFESGAELTERQRIDALVLRQIRKLGIRPARICSDEVFVRRVYLDAIGTLPTPSETRQFLREQDPRKRQALIDSLLDRPEFADYWAMKWADLLRVKSEFPIDLWPNAVQAYHRWIRTSIQNNVPYDRLARLLITASGSNFRDPAANFYRAIQGRDPQTIARAVALAFMGTRAENWPKARLAGMAALFSQVGYKATGEWKEEIVFHDGGKPLSAQPVFPDGKPARVPPDGDPRQLFADWLISPHNPWFSRCIVNRLWYWTLGRGIIHEPDDIRPDNPGSNPELLAYLERELIAGRYDLKRMLHLILVSGTYQLSSIPRSADPRAAAQFAAYPVRRMEAEVLIDAVDQITGTTERYQSTTPEPYTFIPEEQRTIALADGSITSAFLEMFGRPPRDTGLASERNNRPTSAQRLHFLNSSHIRQKIERGPALLSLVRTARTPREVIERLYVAILSRFPTEDERMAAEQHLHGNSSTSAPVMDLAWALFNSAEFLCRH